jgi:23S rRNA (cytidine1920-2'-O)/16S rRNA (cytidine1409-2'-O)-methyltransferase
LAASAAGPKGEQRLNKTRLDVLLVDLGLAATREKAKAYIMAGEIQVDGKPAYKAGAMVKAGAAVERNRRTPEYVSRGGYKMAGAAKAFGLDFAGRVVLDVGASTGGYTDYALQHGARKVYAVDVGYGQLDWRLRQDPRVEVREKVNARYLSLDFFAEPVDLVMMDVSFISVTLIFPVLAALISPQGEIVSLIKPQFETERSSVGKKGIVRDPNIHAAVLSKCIAAAQNLRLGLAGLCYSPITGVGGNIEYFIHLRPGPGIDTGLIDLIRNVVAEARQTLEASV